MATDAARPRVLVTREELEPLGALLRARGLAPVHGPASVLVPTGDPPPTVPPAEVLVSSAAAPRLRPALAAWLDGARVIAVGARTAAALREVGVTVDAVGTGGGDEALGLLRHPRPVFVGARRPAPAVAAAIAAGRLAHWAVYDRSDTGEDLAAAATPPLALVLLASPSAARTWAAVRPAAVAGTPCVVIGATTAQAALAAGLPVVAQAAEASLEGLVAAACQALALG